MTFADRSLASFGRSDGRIAGKNGQQLQAVTLTGTPLGLTAVKFWTRTQFTATIALKRHIKAR
ncbi:MAG: hypothetical protein EOS43_30780 [Mesorhizobium sp.]|nr:MAG: hypothetical protein EOS43_30780 [Mesorhizobium sp.]